MNISRILNVREKPSFCVYCSHTELIYDAVVSHTGNPSHGIPVKPVENALCPKCETLMVVYSQ